MYLAVCVFYSIKCVIFDLKMHQNAIAGDPLKQVAALPTP